MVASTVRKKVVVRFTAYRPFRAPGTLPGFRFSSTAIVHTNRRYMLTPNADIIYVSPKYRHTHSLNSAASVFVCLIHELYISHEDVRHL